MGLEPRHAIDTKLQTATEARSAVVRAMAVSLLYPPSCDLDGIALGFKNHERDDFRPQFREIVDAVDSYAAALMKTDMQPSGRLRDSRISIHAIILSWEFVADGVSRVLLSDGASAWWAFCTRDATCSITLAHFHQSAKSINAKNVSQKTVVGRQVAVDMVHVCYETQWAHEYRIPVVLSLQFVFGSFERAWVGSPRLSLYSMSWVTYAGGDLRATMRSGAQATLTVFAMVARVDHEKVYGNTCHGEGFLVYLFDGEAMVATIASRRVLMPWLRSNVEDPNESTTSSVAVAVQPDARFEARCFAGRMSVVRVTLVRYAQNAFRARAAGFVMPSCRRTVTEINDDAAIYEIHAIQTIDAFRRELASEPVYWHGLLAHQLSEFTRSKRVQKSNASSGDESYHREFVAYVVKQLLHKAWTKAWTRDRYATGIELAHVQEQKNICQVLTNNTINFVLERLPVRSIASFGMASKQVMGLVGSSSFITNERTRQAWDFDANGNFIGDLRLTVPAETRFLLFKSGVLRAVEHTSTLGVEIEYVFLRTMLQRKIAMACLERSSLAARQMLSVLDTQKRFPDKGSAWLERQVARRSMLALPFFADPGASMIAPLMLEAMEWALAKRHLCVYDNCTSAAGGLPPMLLPEFPGFYKKDADAEAYAFKDAVCVDALLKLRSFSERLSRSSLAYMRFDLPFTDETQLSENAANLSSDDGDPFVSDSESSVCDADAILRCVSCLFCNLHYPPHDATAQTHAYLQRAPIDAYSDAIHDIDINVLALDDAFCRDNATPERSYDMAMQIKQALEQRALVLYRDFVTSSVRHGHVQYQGLRRVEREVREKSELLAGPVQPGSAFPVESYYPEQDAPEWSHDASMPQRWRQVLRVNNAAQSRRHMTLYLLHRQTEEPSALQYFYWRPQPGAKPGAQGAPGAGDWNLRAVRCVDFIIQNDGTYNSDWVTMWCGDGAQVAPISFHAPVAEQIERELQSYIAVKFRDSWRRFSSLKVVIDVEVEVQMCRSMRWALPEMDAAPRGRPAPLDTQFLLLRTTNAAVRFVSVPPTPHDGFDTLDSRGAPGPPNPCNPPSMPTPRIMLTGDRLGDCDAMLRYTDEPTQAGVSAIAWSNEAVWSSQARVTRYVCILQRLARQRLRGLRLAPR